MADSLSQALNKNKQKVTVRGTAGQLSDQSPEEIQYLAGQAGLQAPPLTPGGAAAIGANPDQQKMMGTPAQKQSALSLAMMPPEQGLAATLRRKQSRTTLTQDEQQKTQKNTDMQNLGNLGDRVSQFIDTQRQLLEEQQQPVAVATAAPLTQASGTAIADPAALKANLEALRGDPTNMALQVEVNKALGRNINTTLTPDEINNLYESAASSISTGAADTIDDSLNVSTLTSNPQFGYDLTSLSQLLGVPEASLASMNVGQLRSEINRVGDQEFQKTQQLEQQAQSGKLGFAERQAALQAQREQSTTGIRATEADYSSIEQQIQNADQVTFAGQQYAIDELLQDETISNLVREYIESPVGSEIRQRIDSSEPALKQFIDRNAAVLTEAAQRLATAAAEFTQIQEANKAVGKVGTTTLSDGILSKIVPGYGELQSAQIDPNSIPLIASIKSTQNPEASANAINVAVDKEPQVLEELGQLDPNLFKTLLSNGGQRLATYVQDVQDFRDIQAVAESGDIDQIVNKATNGNMDAGTLQAQAREEYTRQLLDFPWSSKEFAELGSISQDPNAVSQWLVNNVLSKAPNPNIETAARGSNQALRPLQVPAMQNMNSDQADMYGKLSSIATGPNSLDANNMLGAGLSMRQVETMLNRNSSAVNKDATRKQFEQKQGDNSYRDFQTVVDSANNIANSVNYLLATNRLDEPQVLQSVFGTSNVGEIVARSGDAQRASLVAAERASKLLQDPEAVAVYGRANLEKQVQLNNEAANKANDLTTQMTRRYAQLRASGQPGPSTSRRG